jgi:hypothetical protein
VIPLLSWCSGSPSSLRKEFYELLDAHSARLITYFLGHEMKEFLFSMSVIKVIAASTFYRCSYLIEEFDNSEHRVKRLEDFGSHEIKELCEFTSLPARIFKPIDFQVIQFPNEELTKNQITKIFEQWRNQLTSS